MIYVILIRMNAGNCCDVISNFFHKVASVHNRNTRFCNLNYFVAQCRTNTRKNFISYAGTVLWNRLSLTIRNCNSVCLFKHELRSAIRLNYV